MEIISHSFTIVNRKALVKVSPPLLRFFFAVDKTIALDFGFNVFGRAIVDMQIPVLP